MKQIVLFKGNKSLLTRLALLVMMIVGGGSNVWADELTVNRYNSPTTNNKFPISGGYVNYAARSEFIIDKDSISSLNGKNITALTFYHQVASTLRTWGNAEFKVYLKEVDTKTFSSTTFLGSYDTPVYTGILEPRNDVANEHSEYEMNITFATPFNYTGTGHLLIGVYCSTIGSDYNYVYFYGISSSNGGLYSYQNSGGTTYTYRENFRLKTTLTYTNPVSKTISADPNEDADFGEVYENKNKVYTITNNGGSAISVEPSITGKDAASFSVLPSGAEISAGGSQDFTLTFNYDSSSPGEKSATLTFTPSDGDYTPLNFDVTATAISDDAPKLSVVPSADAAFGAVKADDSKTYTVTNSGTGTMTVNIASDNATEFSVSKNQITLGADESDTFDVVFNFNASRSGDRSATITLTPTYDVEDAVTISATATAITQPILLVSPTSAYFGSLKVNSSKEITVSNTGYGDMEVNISSSNETFFSVTPSSLTIAQDESETFTIDFNYDPSNLGYKSATITVTPTYDESDIKTITSTATAIEPLFVSPDSKTSFGNVSGNASRTFTVTNLGVSNMDVTIENLNTTDYSVSETSFSAIPAGESRSFKVTFNYNSGATGSKKTATVRVYPNGQGLSHAVSLTLEATPQLSTYAAYTLDEDSPTEILTGTNTIKLKYSAKSGWNTFCVPFGINKENIEYVFGSGCKYYTFSSYDTSAHEITFTQNNSVLSACTPVLVYTESAPTYDDGVMLQGRYVPASHDAGSSSDHGATFQGTYVTKNYNADTDVENPWYGVTPAGRIMKAGSGAHVKGYRAYFTGVSAPTGAPAEVKMFILDADDTPTDVGFVKMVDESAKEVYNLAGQKVQKARKGIYIVNGKKVVIK